jgi:hypothetical protein
MKDAFLSLTKLLKELFFALWKNFSLVIKKKKESQGKH